MINVTSRTYVVKKKDGFSGRCICVIDSACAIHYTLRMKTVFVLILLCLLPVAASAHPGKTDRFGGHMCLKGCGEWGLFYEEYHLHDKDGKPVRIAKKAAAKVRKSAVLPGPVQEQPRSSPAVVSTVTTTRYVTVVLEENIVSHNPLLFVLLMLLLLLLVLRMSSRKGASGGT